MKTRNGMILGAAAMITALAGTTAVAVDFDPTFQAGQYDTTKAATILRSGGGNYENVRVTVPFLLPDTQSLTGPVAVQAEPLTANTRGLALRPLGAITTFTSNIVENIQAVIALGTTDLDFPMGSTNAFLGEGTEVRRSNNIGALLPDGTLVFRENFDFTSQNNFGFEEIRVEPQTAIGDVMDTAANLLFDTSLPGIGDGSSLNPGDVFLGNPGAARDPNTARGAGSDLLIGGTTFEGFNGNLHVPSGTNVWRSVPGGVDPNAPVESWLEADTIGSLLPTGEDVSDVRQTQPHLQTVTDPNGENSYTVAIFGVGITGGVNLTGGSFEPRYFVIDSATAGDSYAGAVFIEADVDPDDTNADNHGGTITNVDLGATNPAFSFIDHQATGGGGAPFIHSQFDMNERGDVAALWKDERGSVDVFEIRVYPAIWTGGVISGYGDPVVAARTGEDGIESSFLVDDVDGMGNPIMRSFQTVTGPAIDNEGRVAFVALTDAVFEAGQFVGGTNSVLVWRPSDSARGVDGGSLHELVRGGVNPDILDDADAADDMGGDLSLELGFFPVDNGASDIFSRTSLSDEGGFVLVNFRDGVPNDPAFEGGVLFDPNGPDDMTDQSVRGAVMIELGEFTVIDQACPGDCDDNGVVNFSDLVQMLGEFGTPGSVAGCDADESGMVNFSDLVAALGLFGDCP